MPLNRTSNRRPGDKKSSRSNARIDQARAFEHALTLIDTVCCLAGDEHLIDSSADKERRRLRRAIETSNTAFLFEQLLEAFSLQGISDHAAFTYMDQHGRVTWRQIEQTLENPPRCPKLQSHWAFHACGFEKGKHACAEPDLIDQCPLPRHDMRNGRLNQTAYSLYLFIRDVMDGDFVGWVDRQLERATCGPADDRLHRMRSALIEPLCNVFGVSDKVVNLTLAYVLMAAPPAKPFWVETGTSMNAIDTLVHNFLHRTGILRRFKAQHAYGPACYGPNGCADIVARVSGEIDARQFNPLYPQSFPRFVQHAIWFFASQPGLNICNGNQIDDSKRCMNRACPLFDLCDRVCLGD